MGCAFLALLSYVPLNPQPTFLVDINLSSSAIFPLKQGYQYFQLQWLYSSQHQLFDTLFQINQSHYHGKCSQPVDLNHDTSF
jgi:hypothetical protein